MKSTVMLGQPSWVFASDRVEAALSIVGGHLAPVIFILGKRRVSPYFVAPWGIRTSVLKPPLMRILRGDFFCLPLGNGSTLWRDEKHPQHGETANRKWNYAGIMRAIDGSVTLSCTLRTTTRPGTVEKHITLRAGHTAVYSRHVLRGFQGPMTCAHHPMLAFPENGEPAYISTSRFAHGQVCPRSFENSARGGYSQLAFGATFRSLRRVPLAVGGTIDLSRFPTPRGFVDMHMLSSPPDARLGWTAVSRPAEGYVWFALKDPRVLHHTVFWLQNGGRHYTPWNGIASVLGVEDATTYFGLGLAESVRANPLSRRGFATCLQLNPRRPTTINHISGITSIPRGFGRVRTLRPVRGGIELVAETGSRVFVPLDLTFLYQQTDS